MLPYSRLLFVVLLHQEHFVIELDEFVLIFKSIKG